MTLIPHVPPFDVAKRLVAKELREAGLFIKLEKEMPEGWFDRWREPKEPEYECNYAIFAPNGERDFLRIPIHGKHLLDARGFLKVDDEARAAIRHWLSPETLPRRMGELEVVQGMEKIRTLCNQCYYDTTSFFAKVKENAISDASERMVWDVIKEVVQKPDSLTKDNYLEARYHLAPLLDDSELAENIATLRWNAYYPATLDNTEAEREYREMRCREAIHSLMKAATNGIAPDALEEALWRFADMRNLDWEAIENLRAGCAAQPDALLALLHTPMPIEAFEYVEAMGLEARVEAIALELSLQVADPSRADFKHAESIAADALASVTQSHSAILRAVRSNTPVFIGEALTLEAFAPEMGSKVPAGGMFEHMGTQAHAFTDRIFLVTAGASFSTALHDKEGVLSKQLASCAAHEFEHLDDFQAIALNGKIFAERVHGNYPALIAQTQRRMDDFLRQFNEGCIRNALDGEDSPFAALIRQCAVLLAAQGQNATPRALYRVLFPIMEGDVIWKPVAHFMPPTETISTFLGLNENGVAELNYPGQLTALHEIPAVLAELCEMGPFHALLVQHLMPEFFALAVQHKAETRKLGAEDYLRRGPDSRWNAVFNPMNNVFMVLP